MHRLFLVVQTRERDRGKAKKAEALRKDQSHCWLPALLLMDGFLKAKHCRDNKAD